MYTVQRKSTDGSFGYEFQFIVNWIGGLAKVPAKFMSILVGSESQMSILIMISGSYGGGYEEDKPSLSVLITQQDSWSINAYTYIWELWDSSVDLLLFLYFFSTIPHLNAGMNWYRLLPLSSA